MNPGQVIEEVNAEVNNYEAGIHAPKYCDDERERVEFGVVRLQSSVAEPVRYVYHQSTYHWPRSAADLRRTSSRT